jgi:hypothetical protein
MHFELFEEWDDPKNPYGYYDCPASAEDFATKAAAEAAKKLIKPQHSGGIIVVRKVLSEEEAAPQKRSGKKKKLPRLRLGIRRGRQ